MANTERLEEIVAGKKEVLQNLYLREFPKIKSFVLKNKGKIVDAEDIFQKALMQIITRYKVNSFSIEGSFESYFYGACRNLWLRELKKSKRMVTNDSLIEQHNENEDITMAILEQEKWELFQEKLKELSDNCKQLLQLFFQKIPYKEIEKKLGYKSENVVRQRIFNCKSQLSNSIKKDSRYDEIKKL